MTFSFVKVSGFIYSAAIISKFTIEGGGGTNSSVFFFQGNDLIFSSILYDAKCFCTFFLFHCQGQENQSFF